MKTIAKKFLNYFVEKINESLDSKLSSLNGTQVTNFFIEGRIPSLLLIKPNGFRVFLDPRDPEIAVHYLQNGSWEPQITNFLEILFEESKNNGFLKPVFIDVGANIGLHSIVAKKIGFQVFAFEPDPTTFKFLFLNTRINGLSVDLNEIALSNSAGELDFLVDSQSSGMNGLAKSESGTGSKAKLIQNSKRYEIIKVNVNTLDHEFLNKEIEEKDTLYVLKIDTEGAEGEVVEGAMSTLQKQNKYVVICEMHLDNANLVNQMSTLIKAEIERNKIVKLYLLRFEKEPILLDHTDVSTWHRFGDGDIALKVGL